MITLVVTLTFAQDRIEQFHEFESRAAAIMSKYGGRIERAVFIPPSSPDSAAREVHIVTFPDPASFERYRLDPDLASLADLRAGAILATDILIGLDREITWS